MSKDLFCFMYLLGTITPTLRPDLHRVKDSNSPQENEKDESENKDDGKYHKKIAENKVPKHRNRSF